MFTFQKATNIITIVDYLRTYDAPVRHISAGQPIAAGEIRLLQQYAAEFARGRVISTASHFCNISPPAETAASIETGVSPQFSRFLSHSSPPSTAAAAARLRLHICAFRRHTIDFSGEIRFMALMPQAISPSRLQLLGYAENIRLSADCQLHARLSYTAAGHFLLFHRYAEIIDIFTVFARYVIAARLRQ